MTKYLDLSDMQLDDLDSTTVATYLNIKIQEIISLDIKQNRLTDEGMLNIITALTWHENLIELCISNNKYITKLSSSAIIDVLESFPNLKVLS